VSLFASTHDDLADLFDQIPLLATRTGIEDLTGGLTNRNVKVTTPDGVYVARCSDREHNPLGIDRDAEHVNTSRAERAGVGAPVLDYRPDLGVLVIGWALYARLTRGEMLVEREKEYVLAAQTLGYSTSRLRF